MESVPGPALRLPRPRMRPARYYQSTIRTCRARPTNALVRTSQPGARANNECHFSNPKTQGSILCRFLWSRESLSQNCENRFRNWCFCCIGNCFRSRCENGALKKDVRIPRDGPQNPRFGTRSFVVLRCGACFLQSCAEYSALLYKRILQYLRFFKHEVSGCA